MTYDEAVQFLERNNQAIHRVHSEDHYQRAAMVILKTPDKFICESDDDFIGLMHSIARMMARQDEGHLIREAGSPNPLVSMHDYVDDNGECRLVRVSSNPWIGHRIEALEMIQLLPLVYRRVFYLVYIEGCTEHETGELLGYKKTRISEMLTEGITWIRDELRMMNVID